MKQFSPIASPSQVHVYYAEDGEYIHRTLTAGLVGLVGIPKDQVHHFLELDDAKRAIESADRLMPTVAIFDNNTPRSLWRGHELAMHFLNQTANFPNLHIVTVSSSDMGLFYENAGEIVRQIQAMGGEFWAKHAEGHLLLSWLGECLKNGQMMPRGDWLEKLGINPEYRTTQQGRLPIDSRIQYLCDGLTHAQTPEAAQLVLQTLGFMPGDFFRLPSVEVVTRLGYPPLGKEGQRNSQKER